MYHNDWRWFVIKIVYVWRILQAYGIKLTLPHVNFICSLIRLFFIASFDFYVSLFEMRNETEFKDQSELTICFQ